MWAMIIAHESVCDRTLRTIPWSPRDQDRQQTRAEIAHVEAATAIASISFDVSDHNAVSFDAIYHSAVIRAERHEHYLKQNRDWL
jgi:hypothetical protein